MESKLQGSRWAWIIGVSLVIAAAIFSYTLSSSIKRTHTVTVTGAGSCQMRSDWAVWTASIKVQSPNMATGYSELEKARQVLSSYLKKQGIEETSFEFGSISIEEQSEGVYGASGNYMGQRFSGYRMWQEIKLQTTDLDKVKFISRDVTSLLSSGIDVESHAPSYYLRELGDLKISLIEEAAKNAQERAKTLIHGFADIEDIQSIDVGVFQVTGLYENDTYSYGGTYNTTSEWKDVSVTVHATYSID